MKTPQRSVHAATLEAPAGGGAFAIERVSVGVFLIDQPHHRFALGGDKRALRPLNAHQGWILPAGASGVCEFETDHRFVAVEVDDALLRDVGFDPHREFQPQFGQHDPLMLQLALMIVEPPAGATTLYLDTMRQSLAAHLAQLVQPPPERAVGVEDARLRRVIAYIEDHLASDLSLDALAAEAAMSPFHFSRAFKKATGRSPLQFVIAERLSRAKVLLQTTGLTVSEVAHRVGYEDVSRFGQHFKRTFGATPAQARGG